MANIGTGAKVQEKKGNTAMEAKLQTSSKPIPKERGNTGKTKKRTPAEALEILASALKICHEAGIEVNMIGQPTTKIYLPRVQVTDGKLVFLP